MMSEKKKIAIVYDAIFPYVTGGAEKRFFETGKRLARAGYDVHLYGMKSWEGPDIIKLEGMTLHGIMKYEPLYTAKGRRSIGEAMRFGSACLKLFREEFDIVDCCGFPYFSLFALRIVTLIKQKTLFSTWHEVWGYGYWREYAGSWGYFGYLVERMASRMPDKIISVSASTTEGLKHKLGRKREVFMVPNGIDREKIKAAEKQPARSSDVIFAGRLLANKNVDVLIMAISELKKDYPSISLQIIGEGPEKERLEDMTRGENLENNVTFLGFVEENKLFSYMKSSKVLVLPSSREGFGMVVLEANACDLPVLTVDEPLNAAKHLIREGENGLVVGLRISEIADGIKRMLYDGPYAMDPGRGIEGYDWDNIAKEMEKIYSDNINDQIYAESYSNDKLG